MARLRQRIRESTRAFGAVFQNRGLRRLQLAWASAVIGGWAYIVSLAVFAYREDGAYAVGGLAVARWVTSGVAAPIAGVVGDRYPRVRVLIGSCVVRSAMIALAGVRCSPDSTRSSSTSPPSSRRYRGDGVQPVGGALVRRSPGRPRS